MMGRGQTLGIDPASSVLLVLSLLLAVMTLGTARATIVTSVVHQVIMP